MNFIGSFALAGAALAAGLLAASSCRADEATKDAAPSVSPDLQAAAVAKAALPGIDPLADAAMRRMGDFLMNAKRFSINAEVWQDLTLSSGQKIQAGRTISLQVVRPDRFRAEIKTPRRDRELFYDGKTLTLYNRVKKFYGVVEAPGDIDSTLDMASERFGISLPLEDLIVSDPGQSAMGPALAGIHLGDVDVLGVPCEHLAFTMGKVDWELWIEKARPLPKKMLITYRDEEGDPECIVIFTGWDFQPKFDDSTFKFVPPEGAIKIPVEELKDRRRASQPASAQPAPEAAASSSSTEAKEEKK